MGAADSSGSGSLRGRWHAWLQVSQAARRCRAGERAVATPDAPDSGPSARWSGSKMTRMSRDWDAAGRARGLRSQAARCVGQRPRMASESDGG